MHTASQSFLTVNNERWNGENEDAENAENSDTLKKENHDISCIPTTIMSTESQEEFISLLFDSSVRCLNHATQKKSG